MLIKDKIKRCPPKSVINPITQRCIKIGGKVYVKIMKEHPVLIQTYLNMVDYIDNELHDFDDSIKATVSSKTPKAKKSPKKSKM